MTAAFTLVPAIPVCGMLVASFGDSIALVVWTLLAALSWLLVVRFSVGKCGAWCLVSVYCTAVAIDKVVDLQMTFFEGLRWSMDLLDPWLGLRQYRVIVRVILLLLLTVFAVGGTVILVRRDRSLDRGKKLAISGLVLVLLLVAIRLWPGLAAVFSDQVCWVVEAISSMLILCGLGVGFKGLRDVSA